MRNHNHYNDKAMSHNLEIHNSKASFVENGRRGRAWHKLGTVFDGPLTVKEALHHSHADYRVALQPLAVVTPDMRGICLNGG